jgi:hypothetical protein
VVGAIQDARDRRRVAAVAGQADVNLAGAATATDEVLVELAENQVFTVREPADRSRASSLDVDTDIDRRRR